MRVPTRPAVIRALVLTCGLAALVAAAAAGARVASTRGGYERPELVATAFIVLAVPLLRTPMTRLADRLAYGAEGDPYAVVSGFMQRIADALAVDDILPQLARTAAGALHSNRGEVRLWLADGQEWRQTWPPATAAVSAKVSVDVRHAGDFVGRIGVEVPEARGTAADREILDELAGPAGLALANVRLTYDLRRRLEETTRLADQLQASKLRLLEVAAEERARLTAEVEEHVIGPLTAAHSLLTDQPHNDELHQARAAGQEALDALRDLAAGLFPPTLAEHGLAAALEVALERDGRRLRLSTDGLPGQRLTPEVETAAYFCALKIVEDLPRDDGSEIAIRQGLDGNLILQIDSPSALSRAAAASVRDRAEALGGSCRTVPPFEVRLPAAPATPTPRPESMS